MLFFLDLSAALPRSPLLAYADFGLASKGGKTALFTSLNKSGFCLVRIWL
jgi:hypothetical protein